MLTVHCQFATVAVGKASKLAAKKQLLLPQKRTISFFLLPRPTRNEKRQPANSKTLGGKRKGRVVGIRLLAGNTGKKIIIFRGK